ncbi:MAG: CDP-alcohol phosphatidyltransferase family protein [SAR202 cluster bacterium]|nr:CDP-alcohol phosphatidyltransferase family protein [SAR202 cluster bacterium]
MSLNLAPRLGIKPLASRYVSMPVARALHAFGVGPNAVTVAGFLVSALAGWFAADGRLLLAGLVLLAGASFDMFDGALARLAGKASKFGAYLDSVTDRLGEAALLIGLLAYYVRDGHTLGAYLAFGAVVMGGMVSYARARAEGLGIQGDLGFMGRPERIVVLVAGLVLGIPLVALAIILVFATVTTVQRSWHVYRVADSPERAERIDDNP